MKRILAALLVVLFLTPALIKAQFHLSVGPVTGLNFNVHTGSDVDKTGTGFGIIFGGVADMRFSKNFALQTTIFFYDGRYGSYSSTGTDYYYGNYTIDNGASIAYFSIEPLAKFNIGSGFYMVAGPSLGFNMEGSVEQTYTVQNGRIPSNKVSLQNMNVRFELKAGAGMDLPLTKLMTLAPQFTFGYGLTNVQKDVSWKILSFQAGCALKFNLI